MFRQGPPLYLWYIHIHRIIFDGFGGKTAAILRKLRNKKTQPPHHLGIGASLDKMMSTTHKLFPHWSHWRTQKLLEFGDLIEAWIVPVFWRVLWNWWPRTPPVVRIVANILEVWWCKMFLPMSLHVHTCLYWTNMTWSILKMETRFTVRSVLRKMESKRNCRQSQERPYHKFDRFPRKQRIGLLR